MFTGIVRHIGTVRRAADSPAGRRLSIDLGPLAAGMGEGDSLAVNGVCLTATAIDGSQVDFDVVAETLSRSTLGRLAAGGRVNLERSLRLGDGLEGHLVQGHVDGLARLSAFRRDGQTVLAFVCDRQLTDQMAPKGSVCIDGVSLTLAGLADGRFEVAIIPATLAQTTLGSLAVGAEVNVETDIIGKYVRRCLEGLAARPGGTLTLEKLKEAGFF